MEVMDPPLPQELVEEIMLRLPAASLARFRVVSKPWLALIDDRSFANKHRTRDNDNTLSSGSASFVFFWYQFEVGAGNFAEGVSVIDICSSYETAGSIACAFRELKQPGSVEGRLLCEEYSTGLMLFHCNGIVCFAPRGHRSGFDIILLINPVLKQVKEFSLPFHYYRSHVVNGKGFGYDPAADDYKFVGIWKKKDGGGYVALVYALGTDSWRQIEIDVNYESGCLGEGVYRDGVCYWRNVAVGESSVDNAVLALDMSDEKFRSIPLPDSFVGLPSDTLDFSWRRPVVWGDSLAVFNVTEHSEESTVFELWVLVGKLDNGCRASWEKRATVGPLPGGVVPLCLWGEDELLLGTRDHKLLSCNVVMKKLRTICVEIGIIHAYSQFKFYSESLVSILNGNSLRR